MSKSSRGSGVLAHITSLPSPYGIGDLGRWAHRFADFLAEASQSCWQILPLNPTLTVYGNSPYSSISAFAGNPLLLSPELLVEQGLLEARDIEPPNPNSGERVDYEAASEYKGALLRMVYDRNRDGIANDSDFQRFCEAEARWLDEFARFVTLKHRLGGVSWIHWPEPLRTRDRDALEAHQENARDEITRVKFFQYLFFRQWSSLKRACLERGIDIIGDLPIYVSHDSADVWANPHLFKLDRTGRPTCVAGVPPDYFSETGQLWNNPVYDWEVLRQDGFSWWFERVGQNARLFDRLRLDHFRGFVAYWEVPAEARTAVEGAWVKAPAEEFFTALRGRFSDLAIIAEDLGEITPDVLELRDAFGFPGMKILLFAFDGDLGDGAYLPHNYIHNCIVFTGTHDNNTARGWFADEASEYAKDNLFNYLGRRVNEDDVAGQLIRLALMSVADTAILPLQDILGLGSECRMNRPATPSGNWEWRFRDEDLSPAVATALRHATHIYGRAPKPTKPAPTTEDLPPDADSPE